MQRLLDFFRRNLSVKLFLSYLIVILVGVIVLAGAVQIQTPAAIQRHIERMESHLGTDPGLAEDLRVNFIRAINEITTTAVIVSLIAAIAVSLFTSQRIVQPIRAMMQASREIAAGNFKRRVAVVSEDELGALAESFNQMAEELELTEQRRLNLIGDVAHELRTPLTNLRTMLEALTDGVLPPDPATFQTMNHEVLRLQRLVQDLQELSRAEAGEMAMFPEWVDPAQLVSSVVDRLALQFHDKGVALHVNMEPDLPMIFVDPARITQVLVNILGNALQYTPGGGQVWVAVRRGGDAIEFVVRDTGRGIPAEDLPHIFERFYRVDKSRARASGGSGIGLTISKHIVEAHGGRIWAKSEGPGKGSEFGFTLPLSPKSS
ncbi:MAG TPA: HAMP domain-containing protein [Anaerolineae bacterium]|nr:HAMP domain-containing protein [Anaerolineae bacterium]